MSQIELEQAKSLIAAAEKQGQQIPSLQEALNVQHSIDYDPTYPVHLMNPIYRKLVRAVIEATPHDREQHIRNQLRLE
jgi:hypothetical protein